MLTLTSLTARVLFDDLVEHGATAWHGLVPLAQKSTITGVSLSSTSCVKVSSLTAVAIQRFLSMAEEAVTRALVVENDRRARTVPEALP